MIRDGSCVTAIPPKGTWSHLAAVQDPPLRHSRGYSNRALQKVSILLHRRRFPSVPFVGVQPTPCVARRNAGLRTRRPVSVRSPCPVLFNPGGGRMALFTVQPETLWLHDGASLMALAAALERDSRTVKQVTIPVHGANPKRRPKAPSPAWCSQAPCGRRPAGPPPWALRAARGACKAAVQARRTAPPTQPCRSAAEVASLPPFRE